MPAFEPMPERLRERRHEVAGDEPAGSMVRLPGWDSCDGELEALGMLEVVSRYLSGGGLARVTSRGASYEADLAAWEEERDQRRAVQAWQASQEKAEAADREHRVFLHDWHLNLVNGVYAIAGAAVGSVLTHVLGG